MEQDLAQSASIEGVAHDKPHEPTKGATVLIQENAQHQALITPAGTAHRPRPLTR